MGIYTGTITLASVLDGAIGTVSNYEILTTKENSYKFYENASMVYSPDTIDITAWKVEEGTTRKLLLSEYVLAIEVLGEPTYGNILNLLNRLQGRAPLGSTYENLLEALLIQDSNTNNFIFDFKKIIEYVVDEVGNPNIVPEDIALYLNLQNLIMEENFCFLLKIYKRYNPAILELDPYEEDLYALKPYMVEFGTTKNMASFALTSAAIQAAVDNSKLTFNADGLTISEAGFKILDANRKSLLAYNENIGLIIEGSGKFTGHVDALSGSFSGDVTAQTLNVISGNIGGFTIDDSGLYSTDGNSNIIISGKEGTIKANNISLGIGAEISQYIKLGNAFLRNPDENAQRIVLEAGAISLTDAGVLNLGDIMLDGTYSTISGDTFSITPKLATFSNVNVTGKISTVVFENSRVQTVGGSMIFKPSYRIQNLELTGEGGTFYLEENFLGEVGDYLYLIDTEGNKVSGIGKVTVKGEESVTATIPAEWTAANWFSLVGIGPSGSLFIGINSTDAAGYLKPNGITISEFLVDGNENPQEDSTPKTFLGDLTSLNINGLSGYGLYAENVFLTGTLITESSTGETAGINTLNGVKATKFLGESVPDESEIIFWAGSSGLTDSEIQVSAFQVTKEGSLYASQGRFEGAIITESEIRGTDIYTARIHGTGRGGGENYGLSFYDVDDGIIFKKGDVEKSVENLVNGTGSSIEKDAFIAAGMSVDSFVAVGDYWQATEPPTGIVKKAVDVDSISVETFSIGTIGLKIGDKSFISIVGDSVNFKGESGEFIDIYSNRAASSFLHLNENKIYSATIAGDTASYLLLRSDYNQLQINSNNYLKIENGNIELNSSTISISKNVVYGGKMRLEEVASGYNLYIDE